MECVWDVGTETQLTSSEARKGIILDSMYIQGLATCFPKIHKILVFGSMRVQIFITLSLIIFYYYFTGLYEYIITFLFILHLFLKKKSLTVLQ